MGSEAEAEAETDARPLCACVRRSEVWAQNLCMTFFLRHTGQDCHTEGQSLGRSRATCSSRMSTCRDRGFLKLIFLLDMNSN
jgi:hypothetical protein